MIIVPAFFSLERNGKTSYLLGSHHAIPFEWLPQVCQDKILACHTLVTEEGEDYEGEAYDYYKEAVVLQDSDPRWQHQLSPEVFEFAKEMINIMFDHFHESARSQLEDLHLWAADQFVFAGFIYHLAIISHGENPDNSLGMDHALIHFFEHKKICHLEGLMSKIPLHKAGCNHVQTFTEHCQTLAIFLEILNPFSLMLNLENLDKALTKSGLLHRKKEILSEFEDINPSSSHMILSDYTHGVYLHSPSFAREENEDEETVFRTTSWIPRFIKIHIETNDPVCFVVGCAHLIGEKGLLNALPEIGFTIRHIKPDGSFEPYEYPFSSKKIKIPPALTWLRKMEQEMAMTQWKEKNNHADALAVVPYDDKRNSFFMSNG